MTQSIARSLYFISLIAITFAQVASADYYSCPKKVYSQGWLRKYEYKGNTWSANIKKSGFLSSTAHSSTENTTSSVDPGVTTGEAISSVQYTSSWGECAMFDMEITMKMRDDFIDQNLNEIKKQVAQGSGYHIDSLAALSGCAHYDSVIWAQHLQAHTGEFYDSIDGRAFRQVLDSMINSDSMMKPFCQARI